MTDKWWFANDPWPEDTIGYCYACKNTCEADCEDNEPICSLCGSSRIVDATGLADWLEIQGGER